MATASRTKTTRSEGTRHGVGKGSRRARPREAKRSAPSGELGRRDGGLRRELIDAALALVESSGTRGLSWREIARRAAVSHSAAYRHFENKEALLAAVAEQGFRSLAERMIEQVAVAPDDVAMRLEALAIAYVEFAAGNPAHFRVMFGRDIPDIDKHPALREAYDETNGLFREGVARVLENAGKLGMEVDADHFALMAWSLVHGLASLIVDGRVGDVGGAGIAPAEHMRAMTSLIESFVRSLRAKRTAARALQPAPSRRRAASRRQAQSEERGEDEA